MKPIAETLKGRDLQDVRRRLISETQVEEGVADTLLAKHSLYYRAKEEAERIAKPPPPRRPERVRTAVPRPEPIPEPIPPQEGILRVLMADGTTLLVPAPEQDIIAKAKAEEIKRRADREIAECLAIGNTITRAYDLCSRLAQMAQEGRRTL